MDCLICFSPIEGDKWITCGDSFCIAKICVECAELFMAHCEKNNVMPKCPSTFCKGLYLLSGVKSLSKKTVDNYRAACISAIIKEKGVIAKKSNEEEDILAKLRKEREKFIKDSFPAAISKTVNMAFKSKLIKIEKHRAAHISEQLNASNKICMNLSCSGHLDVNMVCMICETKFCRKCEELYEEGHTCKKEDLESISLINKMVKCPKCNLAIERSEGCNNMTCAHCNMKFIYTTGEAGGSGGHVTSVSVQNEILLSSAYRDRLTDKSLLLLLEFESKKPHIMSERAIINSLKKVYRKNSNGFGIVNKFDKLMKSRYSMKNYQQASRTIEKNLIAETCTEELLREAVDKVN